jgi:hypothetical protein
MFIGTVNEELLLRNEYLAAENRILRGQIKGRLLPSDGEKVTLAEIVHRLGQPDLMQFRPTSVQLKGKISGALARKRYQ